jgi:hypothetical protein
MTDLPPFLRSNAHADEGRAVHAWGQFSGWYLVVILTVLTTQAWANRELISNTFDGAFGFGHVHVEDRVGPPTAEPVAPKNTNQMPQEEIEWLLQQGNLMLVDGDVGAERLYFRRAANNGSADAAFSLGQTYDPLVLKQLEVVGMSCDFDEARHWYNIAVSIGGLGGHRAQLRLRELDMP